MKFWQLVSICWRDGHPELVAAKAEERDEWRQFGEWDRQWERLVATQTRTVLDFELPDDYTRAVLCEVRLTFYDALDGHLRAWRLWRSDEALPALEAYLRYGGALIEETLEKGAQHTRDIRVLPTIPPDLAERSAADAAAGLRPSLMRGVQVDAALRALMLLHPQVTVEVLPELVVIAMIWGEYPLVLEAIGRVSRAQLATSLPELVLERLDEANWYEFRRLAELLDRAGLDEPLSALVKRALASTNERAREVGQDFLR